MDHLEAKAQLVSLLEFAQTTIGGEWQRSDSGARDCERGDGTGASYLLSRIGPGLPDADQQRALDAIAADWAENGVDATLTTKPEVNGVVVTELRYPAEGADPDGFFVELWISDRASTLAGQSRCASGDAAAINAG